MDCISQSQCLHFLLLLSIDYGLYLSKSSTDSMVAMGAAPIECEDSADLNSMEDAVAPELAPTAVPAAAGGYEPISHHRGLFLNSQPSWILLRELRRG